VADDEPGLIKRSQRGDANAYEQLVRAYQDVAFWTAFIITRNSADAEDAAQNAFLNAWLHLNRFRLDAPFRPWLLRIVANEAKNRRLAASRRANHQLPEDRSYFVPSPDAGPEQRLIAGETSAWLLAHLERLQDSDRLVIFCRHILVLSEIETAAILGCRRGTVKSRLHRALRNLRDAIAEDSVKETPS